jgi:hypothetical protein
MRQRPLLGDQPAAPNVAQGSADVCDAYTSDLDLLVLRRASELKLNSALKPVARKLGRAVRATA